MHSDAHRSAPYAEALEAFADARPLGLIVPAHGMRADAGAGHLAELLGERAVQLDVPMLIEGVDLGADSPYARALELAADAWGARRTWFLANGASQGNRTAAFAARGLGERVLIQRNSHSSFIDGLLLAGLVPSFIAPSIDAVNGITHGLSPASLDAALAAEAAAGRAVQTVYIVSPSYFGSTSDVAGLAQVAHEHGAALIVDGAWGPHFGFHPELPESPLRLGADLVVSSTHKLAGSLGQSAMLHLGDTEFADRLEPLVARSYRMTASTSASSILLASLDVSRRAMVLGSEAIERAIGLARQLRSRVSTHPLLALVDDGFDAFPDIVANDLLRVAIDVSATGRSGHWVRKRAIEEHGIYFEMSTATTVVVVIGALTIPDVDRIMGAFEEIIGASQASLRRAESGAALIHPTAAFPELPDPGRLRMLPRDAYFAASELVPALEAIGRVSADTLAAYPPGIPNVMPGEEITAETVAFLQAVAASPTGHVRGAADPLVATLRVVAKGATE